MLHIRNGALSVAFLGEGEIKRDTFAKEKQPAATYDERIYKEFEDMGYRRE